MRATNRDERRELGLFLSDRRAKLRPADFGLAEGRRRTPGLRREEVAQLAGISVSWYTWLEQGRDIRVSDDALRRIAEVFGLNDVEAGYLSALSSRAAPVVKSGDDISHGLRMLVEAIDPIPAYIRNPQFDILVWNDAIADLFVDYGSLESHERNTLRLLFLYPPYRTLILDWEQMARGMISAFRAARASAQDKKPFDLIVSELSDVSGEFRAWWQDTHVQGFDEGMKRLMHPTLGLTKLTYVALTPEGRPDLSLVTYIPQRPACDSRS
ncbi:Helix-turn-helix domain-containing protein [Dyella sp. 333MFSha]|nr:Helix-turn-helix domain-containing protein [Dyella sp. 333MFSha]